MKAALKLPVNVKVTYRYGAYNTAAVAGQRASSTSSAETAAGRLVDKVTAHLQQQPGTLVARPLPARGLKPGVSMWQIEANDPCGAVGGHEPQYMCAGHELDMAVRA